MLTRSHKTKISPRSQLRYIREHLVGRWNEDEVPNGSRNPMLQEVHHGSYTLQAQMPAAVPGGSEATYSDGAAS